MTAPSFIPVDPDGPTAQRWVLRELAGTPYQQAKPTGLQDLVQRLLDWLQSLAPTQSGGTALNAGGLLPVVIVVIVVALVVVAFLVFGLPRLNRRSRAGDGDLFDDDDRDADGLRRDARRAAADGDFSTAVVEMFRALARRLEERAVVAVFPGTTAHGFARRAGDAFPDAAERLAACADDFDAVRYLGLPGTAPQWQRLESLEAELHDARPVRSEDLDELAAGLR